MELFLLYIWLKLGTISTFLIISAVILTICFLIMMARVPIHNENYEYKIRLGEEKKLYFSEVPWKRLLIPSIFCALFAGFLPTKTDVAVLVAGHYALKLSDTPEAGKLMTLIRKKANDILDEELGEKPRKPYG